MIKPTVGRVVWFYYEAEQMTQYAAIVTAVHSDTCVNLCVFDINGGTHGVMSVFLRQENEPVPAGPYCEWMPYQIGQAKRHEAEQAQRHAGGVSARPVT